MFHDQDLLRIRAKDYGDFARQLLRKLYGKSELAECILPPGHPRFTRPPLETNVFKCSTVRNCHCHACHFFILFHPQSEAMAAKYRLSSLYYDGFYNKLVRPKLTDFLIDERKRQRKEKTKTTTEDTNVRDEAYHV